MHISAIGQNKSAQGLKAQLFSIADANSDQSLNVDEFKSLLDSAANPAAKKKAAAAPALAEIFAKLDSNGDGGLSADELGNGMSGIRSRFHHLMKRSANDGDDDATGTKAVADVQRARNGHWLMDAMGSQLRVNQRLSIA